MKKNTYNFTTLKTSFKDYLKSFLFQDYFSSRVQNIILILILFLILMNRLYTIHTPIIERAGWKEIDYIAISKNYLANGFNFIKPTITWPAEAPRVTAMECPIVPYLASFLYYFFGFNAYTVRLITLLAFLSIILLEFKLVKKELGQIPALLAALISGLLPLHSFFSNILFSDPTMIAFSMLAIYYFSKWMDSGKTKHVVLATFGFTMAILLKLEPLYLSIIFLGLFFHKYKFDFLQYKKLIIFGLVSIILPIAWYSYAYYLTYHSIDVFGIYKGHDKFQTFDMLSHTTWYLLMRDNLVGLASGKLGIFLILIGFTSLIWIRKGLLFFLYLATILIYFMVVAEGNIDMPYRQFTIIPVFSCFMAIGAIALMYPLSLWAKFPKKNQQISILSISAVIVLIIHFRHYDFKKDYYVNNAVPQEWPLSKIVKKYSNNKSKMVTLGAYSLNKGGNDVSPVIYYYTGIQGWTLQKNEWNADTVEKLKNKGADLLVGYNLYREPGMTDFVDTLEKIYPLLYENKKEGWVILSLKNSKNLK